MIWHRFQLSLPLASGFGFGQLPSLVNGCKKSTIALLGPQMDMLFVLFRGLISGIPRIPENRGQTESSGGRSTLLRNTSNKRRNMAKTNWQNNIFIYMYISCIYVQDIRNCLRSVWVLEIDMQSWKEKNKYIICHSVQKTNLDFGS